MKDLSKLGRDLKDIIIIDVNIFEFFALIELLEILTLTLLEQP